jgi:hypothetical protein
MEGSGLLSFLVSSLPPTRQSSIARALAGFVTVLLGSALWRAAPDVGVGHDR